MSDVAIIFGGPSPEHDVSVLTGLQAARELAGRGDAVHALYWSKAGTWFDVEPGLEASAFVDGVPPGSTPLRLVVGPQGGFVVEGGRLARARPYRVDVAIVCCHGGPGEDGTLQGILDTVGIPYSGPTARSAALGMDKLAFGALLRANGAPALERVLLERGTTSVPFDGPYIVKPRFGGSSIGIEVVADLPTARGVLDTNRHLDAGAVLEPFRADCFDVQIGVRTWPELALSAIERPLRSARPGDAGSRSEILGYADKYQGGAGMASAPRELPAQLDDKVASEIRSLAALVAAVAGLRGVARVDFLSDGTDVYVNEVNTIPGSLARYLWVDPPVPFGSLLADLLAEARARPTIHWSSAGADGSVLRGAASIAAKLA
ncbi:MAG TPA: hypothetical protein VGL60_13455 [Acidimicrobiales bacterium]